MLLIKTETVYFLWLFYLFLQNIVVIFNKIMKAIQCPFMYIFQYQPEVNIYSSYLFESCD